MLLPSLYPLLSYPKASGGVICVLERLGAQTTICRGAVVVRHPARRWLVTASGLQVAGRLGLKQVHAAENGHCGFVFAPAAHDRAVASLAELITINFSVTSITHTRQPPIIFVISLEVARPTASNQVATVQRH
jgi:hypothetical protein